MAERGDGVGRVELVLVELTGGVVDCGRPGNDPIVFVAPDVSLFVGGGNGLVDFDFMTVDGDLDDFLKIGRGGLVHPDQPSLEVSGEEIFVLPGGEIRKLVVIALDNLVDRSRAHSDCSLNDAGATWPWRGNFRPP